MWFPISISRTSLLALAVVGVADRPPAAPPAFVKPAAAVAVGLEAPIYGGRMTDGDAVLRGFRDSVIAFLRGRYRYVAWSDGTDSAPEDTLFLRVVHDVTSADNVRLMLLMRGAHAGGDTVVAMFEALDDVWDQTDWSTPGVLSRWTRRLRAIAEQQDIELIHRVLVQLPLAVQLQVTPATATIPIGPRDIANAQNPNPEFKLRAMIVDTLPARTSDPAELFLMRCQSGAAVYVCQAERAVFLGDTIDGADAVARELGSPDRSIQPTSLHLWRYHPDNDPRAGGTIDPGGAP